MARFLKHGPCKKCGSRDNLGYYDDGSTYCFGCHAYSPATRRPEPTEKKVVMDIRPSLKAEIPEPNISWLRKYLNDDQIGEFFSWSPYMDRHVYVEVLPDESLYWEARKVGPLQGISKIISAGSKPMSLKGKWKETGVVVLVEDIISAIKVGEHAGVLCLHGSIIPNNLYTTLGKIAGIKRIILWLDRDKLSAATVYESKFRVWGKECSVIMTPKDPKDYSDNEIKDILKEAI